MNILQILPSLDVGGVETGTIDLARYLVSAGHKVVVISGGGRLVKELDIPNARHYTLPVGQKSIIQSLRMIKAIARIIRREDIDIIHARSRVPALSAFFAAKLTGRIFITTSHGYYRKHFLSSVMGWGRFVIVASNIVAKHMIDDFGVPHERIRLIPRGVDLNRFIFTDPESRWSNEFRVGIVARITPLKGHADFIKAIAILARQIPSLKAYIVGSAPKAKYKEDLDLLIRRLGLTRTVEFLGSRDDIPSVMSKLDVLVSSTVTPEAFGRSIIEAQASGVPVVSTRVGGVVDIIEDEATGLLSRPFDPNEMAAKLLRLYRDRSFASRLAKNARLRVEERYRLDIMTSKTVAVYEEAMRSLNVLVIKMSALGDVILSVPSLRAIREKFANASIKVLVGIDAREALDRCPYINDRIVCDFKVRDRGLKGFIRLANELQKDCFDIVIDLQNNKRSHLLSFLTLANLRYGYDNGKLSFLLNKRIKDDAPYLDPVEHQFRILKSAGAKPRDKGLELWPSESDEAYVQTILKDSWLVPGQELVGINVKASDRWISKNWPAQYIAELCTALAREYNVRAVLTGAARDLELANKISRLTNSKPIIAAGKTSVLQMVALMKHFRVYVTPDSAPMHIAAAAGVPFVALFGPTDPSRHLPPAKEYVVISKSKDLRCGPCYSGRCMKKFRCMRKISVEEVFDFVKKYLATPALL